LRADGNGLIDGLFAAGNAAASPFGCSYPGPGATIGPALVFGTRAGQAAHAWSR
jgi:3-oxosteroid 1-dehydrogenase